MCKNKLLMYVIVSCFLSSVYSAEGGAAVDGDAGDDVAELVEHLQIQQEVPSLQKLCLLSLAKTWRLIALDPQLSQAQKNARRNHLKTQLSQISISRHIPTISNFTDSEREVFKYLPLSYFKWPVFLNLDGTNFSKLNLRQVILNDYNLDNVNFSDADLSFADLTNASLEDANLTRCKLSGTSLRGADLTNAILTGADFSGIRSFAGVNFTGVDLSHRVLSGINFNRCNFTRANLSSTYLDRVDVTNAQCINTNFTGAFITGSRFNNSVFNGARMTALSNWRGASFNGATFTNVVRSAEQLENVLTAEQLAGTIVGQ